MKKIKFLIMALFIIFSFVCKSEKIEKGIILGDGVRLRNNPDGKIITKLNKNSSVIVLGKTKEEKEIGGFTAPWYRIKTDKNEEGWIFGQYLQIIDLNKARITLSVNDEIGKVENLYNYSIIGKIELNENKYYLFHGMTCDECDDDSRLVLLSGNNLKVNMEEGTPIFPGTLYSVEYKKDEGLVKKPLIEITGYFGEIEKSVYGMLVNYNYTDPKHEDKYFIYKIDNAKIISKHGKGNKSIDKNLDCYSIPGKNRDTSP